MKTNTMTNWQEAFNSNKPSIIDDVEVIGVTDEFVFVKYNIGDLKDVKAVFDIEDNIEKIMEELSSIASCALAQHVKFDEYYNHR